MPDTDDLKKTVDLDTSGPAMDVDVPETKEEDIVEQKETAVEESAVRPVVEEKPEVKTESVTEEKKDDTELEQYSDSVQKRIAKLTRKMREAERQKEEAIEYAKGQKSNADKYRKRYESLDGDYTKEFEKRVTSGTEAIKTKLAAAIASGDVNAQVEAQSELAQLSMDASRLARIKDIDNKVVTTAPEEAASPPQPQRQPDPKADAWAQKNPWFGTDNAMTYTAFDIHKQLVEQEGFDLSLIHISETTRPY